MKHARGNIERKKCTRTRHCTVRRTALMRYDLETTTHVEHGQRARVDRRRGVVYRIRKMPHDKHGTATCHANSGVVRLPPRGGLFAPDATHEAAFSVFDLMWTWPPSSRTIFLRNQTDRNQPSD